MNSIVAQAGPGVSGRVGHIQKYSLQDGPGIRTTVFLKGCPLQCAWCHNPENLLPVPEVMVTETRCVRCGLCAETCPQAPLGGPVGGASRAGLAGSVPDCLRCGACVEACPSGARRMVGRDMSVAEVLAEVLKDRMFYEESGGGVTFSGGEPLAQHGFVGAALEQCRQRGLHTAVDTCGYGPEAALLGLAARADLFLYDLKIMDEAAHEDYCGVSNRLIHSNLKALGAVHDQIWLRIPVIPGVNDTRAEAQAMARFAAGVRGIRQVTLLPYHQTGVQKFKRLGLDYRLASAQPPSQEAMEAFGAVFAAAGLPVKIGG